MLACYNSCINKHLWNITDLKTLRDLEIQKQIVHSDNFTLKRWDSKSVNSIMLDQHHNWI